MVEWISCHNEWISCHNVKLGVGMHQSQNKQYLHDLCHTKIVALIVNLRGRLTCNAKSLCICTLGKVLDTKLIPMGWFVSNYFSIVFICDVEVVASGMRIESALFGLSKERPILDHHPKVHIHEIRRISGEIHPKPYKIRCFNKNSSVWEGAWRGLWPQISWKPRS